MKNKKKVELDLDVVLRFLAQALVVGVLCGIGVSLVQGHAATGWQIMGTLLIAAAVYLLMPAKEEE
jgi:ethanolamine transporter EutH